MSENAQSEYFHRAVTPEDLVHDDSYEPDEMLDADYFEEATLEAGLTDGVSDNSR